MSVLAELDQTQAELQSEFPGWRIWYVYRAGAVSWAARREPVLNTQSAGDLRAAMLKVTASDDGDVSKVLEDIGAPSPSTRKAGTIPRTRQICFRCSLTRAPKTTDCLTTRQRSTCTVSTPLVRQYSVASSCLRMR